MQNKVYELIHNFWLMAAVVHGIKIQVWKDGLLEPHITTIWKREKLLHVNGTLTDLGAQMVRCNGLLTYEATMLQDQLFDRSGETNPDNYVMLRDGLKGYCEQFIWPTLKVLTNLLPPKIVVLDYCGGSGSYLECILEHYPDSRGFLIDKAPNISKLMALRSGLKGVNTVNFKENPNWFHLDGGTDITCMDYIKKFNLVMLNEILHCCDEDDIHYLLDSSHEMLMDSGRLLVTEQIKNPFLDWRLSDYTDHGQSLEIELVIPMLDKAGFMVENILHSGSHWFILAIKTGE